jgi:hypothetical protein
MPDDAMDRLEEASLRDLVRQALEPEFDAVE